MDMDKIDIAPTLTGRAGRAWEIDMEKARAMAARLRPDATKNDTTVGCFCAEAPYAHPIWHSYMIGIYHLRPLEGIPAAKINLPGATHELIVVALNPELPRTPFVAGEEFPKFLTPINFCAQIICPDDAAAHALLKGAVQDVIDGKLNPDTDYIRHWMQRFGSNMIRDPEHAGETKIIMGDQEIVIPAQPAPKEMN